MNASQTTPRRRRSAGRSGAYRLEQFRADKEPDRRKQLETIALSCAAAVFAVLYGLEVVNWFRLIRCRKPGVPFSIWLIYQPSLLTDEGARALWRYWGFGPAAFAWAAFWFALWPALWAPPDIRRDLWAHLSALIG